MKVRLQQDAKCGQAMGFYSASLTDTLNGTIPRTGPKYSSPELRVRGTSGLPPVWD
jgi:hypothetical protein